MGLREEADRLDREQRQEFVALAETGRYSIEEITAFLGQKYRDRYIAVFLEGIDGKNLQTSESMVASES
jgi:hypothetical protein